MSKDRPRIMGYARSSPFDDEPPAEEQTATIEARARALDGDLVRCYVDKGDGRAAYQELLNSLQEHDHLVVRELSAISATFRGLTGAIHHLAGNGVHVHTIKTKGWPELDLDPHALNVLAQTWRLRDAAFKAYVQASTKRALRRKREAGQACTGAVPIGKRRVTRRLNGETFRFDDWDVAQVDIIREIWRRRNEGETLAQIAEDFWQRRLRKSDGSYWAHRGRGKRKPSIYSIQRAWHAYAATLDENPLLEST